MSEEIISLETAKLAKENGFNLNSPAFYGCDNPSSGNSNKLILRTWEDWANFGKEESQGGTLIYSAPTQSLLQRWLREKHNIHIEVYVNQTGWGWILTKLNGTIIKEITDWKFSDTYEQALEAGLLEALELIKV